MVEIRRTCKSCGTKNRFDEMQVSSKRIPVCGKCGDQLGLSPPFSPGVRLKSSFSTFKDIIKKILYLHNNNGGKKSVIDPDKSIEKQGAFEERNELTVAKEPTKENHEFDYNLAQDQALNYLEQLNYGRDLIRVHEGIKDFSGRYTAWLFVS